MYTYLALVPVQGNFFLGIYLDIICTDIFRRTVIIRKYTRNQIKDRNRMIHRDVIDQIVIPTLDTLWYRREFVIKCINLWYHLLPHGVDAVEGTNVSHG